MCIGMGIPVKWDSHGNPIGMGTAYGQQMSGGCKCGSLPLGKLIALAKSISWISGATLRCGGKRGKK